MTLAFPAVPGNTVVTGPAGGHQLEPDVNGNLVIGNANANGQALMVASAPVAIASDQSAVPTKQSGSVAWTLLYNTTQTGVSTWAGSGDISVGNYREFLININVTAITGTNIAFKTYRKDSFTNLINLQTFTAITTVSSLPISIAPGSGSTYFLGNIFQVLATLTAITSITFTVDVYGR